MSPPTMTAPLDPSEILPPGHEPLYRHHKGGLYRVLFHARESTNSRAPTPDVMATVVVYVSLTHGGVFARDAQEFYGHTDDALARRFALVPAEEQAQLRRAGQR